MTDNRDIFVWHERRGSLENTNRLAAVVATKAVTELFKIRGVLHRLQNERLVAIDRAGMREIITKHIKTFKLN
jgi:hypothetical protein